MNYYPGRRVRFMDPPIEGVILAVMDGPIPWCKVQCDEPLFGDLIRIDPCGYWEPLRDEKLTA